MTELVELFWKAYEGRGVAKVAARLGNKPFSEWR